MALLQFNNYLERPKLVELITIWRHPLPPTLHYFWKGALSINFCFDGSGQATTWLLCSLPSFIETLTFRELTWWTTCFFFFCRLWHCYDPVKYSPRSLYISNIHFNNIFWLRISTPKISPFGYSDQKFVYFFISAMLTTSYSFILSDLIQFSTSVNIN